MKIREQVIADCFQSWIEKDVAQFQKSFTSTAVYIESWGPAYRNLEDMVKWFHDWNEQNKVLQWEIKNFWHSESTCICEWYFQCKCDGTVDGFDGTSIIEFNDKNKIVHVKEFQSKTPNCYPYE